MVAYGVLGLVLAIFLAPWAAYQVARQRSLARAARQAAEAGRRAEARRAQSPRPRPHEASYTVAIRAAPARRGPGAATG